MNHRERQFGIDGVTVVAAMLIVLGLWSVDISVSALLTKGILTNGFWVFSPMQVYHMGIYLIMACTALLAMISLYRRERHDVGDSN